MTNPTYHQTVVASPQWKAWEKVAHEHGFDWHESVECGWLSPEHFQAFLAYQREEVARKSFDEGMKTMEEQLTGQVVIGEPLRTPPTNT